MAVIKIQNTQQREGSDSDELTESQKKALSALRHPAYIARTSGGKQMNFKELLFSYIDKLELKDSEVYKKVDIDRKLFSKIRCDINYIPRRNVIIKLCLALGLERNEFNKLLNNSLSIIEGW